MFGVLLTPVLLVENTNNTEKCFLNSDIFALILIYLLFQQRPEGLMISVTRQETERLQIILSHPQNHFQILPLHRQ